MRIELCKPGTDAWRALVAHTLVSTRSDASKSFFGDSTCELENQRESCFAAEWCENNADPSKVPVYYFRELARDNRCYVALNEKNVFCGVIAVTEKGYVHSLCVPQRARGHKVGARLLHHAIRKHGAEQTLSLTVAKSRREEGVLAERYGALISFYTKRGFVITGDDPEGDTHMVRKATAAQMMHTGLGTHGYIYEPFTPKSRIRRQARAAVPQRSRARA